jgi:hypothetical protein
MPRTLPVLWEAYARPDVEAVERSARKFAAQIKLTDMRRKERPDRTTWAPTDQTEPEEPPAAGVRDGDAALWLRNARSRRWRMKDFRASEHEARAGKALTWQELAYHYGPLTAEQ